MAFTDYLPSWLGGTKKQEPAVTASTYSPPAPAAPAAPTYTPEVTGQLAGRRRRRTHKGGRRHKKTKKHSRR